MNISLNNNTNSNNILSGSNKIAKLPIRRKMEPTEQFDLKAAMLNANGIVRRKHCRCTKSLCLKLYCECFANGQFCRDCECKHCFNKLQYEDERQIAMQFCSERNPKAFKPKITTSQKQGGRKRHSQGCNCKRSGCLKNYCECYEAKVPCSGNCKCLDCSNFEDPSNSNMALIDQTIFDSHDDANNKTDFSTEEIFKNEPKGLEMCNQIISGEVGAGGSVALSGSNGVNGQLPNTVNFITPEVVDATIQCMLSQADECANNGLSVRQTEKMVMEEMGRCLVDIINFSMLNTGL